ncbi:monovalent cation/H+ antiporter subunit D [Nitrococcus mobilis]|uniref:NADH dehydrogenase subunit N n=1 Tax=Nitrococcus mobilis Nb-231 TaxID=314278 RepID=A4BLD2_9GAMM|nr:monovalent cation/H+ antiporter subunit D [Nitrococcus mobilis]EAR23120.1 NADH dehydrogenase subunit N [Nitrococcus mobilis Nb-231]
MIAWTDHLLIMPVVLPLVTGTVMLLIDERRHGLKAAINIGAIIALTGTGLALLGLANAPPTEPTATQVGVYRLGDWPVPFGIVLVVDRLAALMLVMTSVLALASVVFSLARWHRAGAHFHSLFQFLLVGLNGAFLTGDLFNLFVFFELLLAASYGLMLHGSGTARVQAGLHYIAVNLAGSLLFLIGVSLLYAVAGTLNMADLATRIPLIPASDRMLLEVGAAALGIAFLVKAGMWPLGFWLPSAYSVATPPVAAIFAILSKVGVYAVLRLSLLLFSEGDTNLAPFGQQWLLYGGMATIAFGAIGVLAAQDTARLAGFAVLISSGTVLAAIGTGHPGVTASALFYLISSTLAISAFFLLVELIERGRGPGADILAVTLEVFGEEGEVDVEAVEEVGIATPVTLAVLGLSFIGCALVLAGLPPLSGFIAKFALLTALLSTPGAEAVVSPASWALLALLIVSGLATLIAMSRAGMRVFWIPLERAVPQVRLVELAPIAALLLACAVLTVRAEPILQYVQATARSVHNPHTYVRGVLATPSEQSAPRGGDS